MLRVKRSKKGLSNAVTALILVIASVIIIIVVVGYSFGLFGTLGYSFGLFGTLGSTPEVKQVGTGKMILIRDWRGIYYYNASLALHSTGNVQILGATIVGTTYSAGTEYITTPSLTAGINSVTISFPTRNPWDLQVGATYTISITLSNGQTVLVPVVYLG